MLEEEEESYGGQVLCRKHYEQQERKSHCKKAHTLKKTKPESTMQRSKLAGGRRMG